jgi:HEAT repeat protein
MMKLKILLTVAAVLVILVIWIAPWSGAPPLAKLDAHMEQLRTEDNVEALESEIQSKDVKRARRAVETLGYLGQSFSKKRDRAIKTIRVTMKNDSRQQIRQTAVIAYAKAMETASPKTHDPAPLGEIVRTDKDKNLVICSINALGDMGAYEELETLLQAMNNDDITIRRRAAEAVVLVVRRRYTFHPNASPETRLREIDRIRQFWKFYQDNVTKFHKDKRKKQANKT